MLGALIIAVIFYFIGAFISGKLVKKQVETWKALLSSFLLFIVWTWFLYLTYEANIPQSATAIVGIGCIMLYTGLRSDKFLPADKKKKTNKRLEGEAKKLYEIALENYKADDFQVAIEKLLRANELQPNNKTVLIGLSHNYSKIKDFSKALHYMEKAIRAGYKKFDKIQTHEDFTELRKSKIYQEFVENGYKQEHE